MNNNKQFNAHLESTYILAIKNRQNREEFLEQEAKLFLQNGGNPDYLVQHLFLLIRHKKRGI